MSKPLRTDGNRLRSAITVVFASMVFLSSPSSGRAAPPVRIKDVTQLAGEHPNTLTGLGLVTGLSSTGGSGQITKQLAMTVLQQLGQRADPSLRENIQRSLEKTNNISAVIVRATLPPHAKKGQRLDVVVSTFDDAKSLQGGELLETFLTGADGETYVLASGPISINGGNFGGQAASVVKNHATTGRVAAGGIVEVEVPTRILEGNRFLFLLNHPQFETACRIAKAINLKYPDTAVVLDPASVQICVPDYVTGDPFPFIAECQELTIIPDTMATVIINERTGTIVITENVRMSSIAITHGNLIVSTAESLQVSQPAPLSQGETTTVPSTQVEVTEQQAMVSVFDQSATVRDLAESLNALGVTPRDLSVIFQMLKESGALHAEVELK
jgi:flagellar P-ring protein precursor FlgI